jgi:DNA-binding XRE family transcriptional regulator
MHPDERAFGHICRIVSADSCRRSFCEDFTSVTRQQRHDLIALGEAVREIRAQRRFSAIDLARASGVPLRQLTALEEGRLDPSIELLHELAEGMGIGQSVFYRRAEELEAGGDEQA